jgi:hypothetical protein
MSGGTPNLIAGYGFLRADSALRKLAAPTPSFIKITPQDPNITPGTQSIVVNITGENNDPNSVLLMRGEPVPTTIVNSSGGTAIVPAYPPGNPPFQISTPPIAPVTNGVTNGGVSNTLFFTSVGKKIVRITAKDTSKRYGEIIPPLSYTITVDGQDTTAAHLGLKDLGLRDASGNSLINVNTTATTTSNVGTFDIIPTAPVLNNSTDPVIIGLKEVYDYQFVNGDLQIKKMPVTIRPDDIEVVIRRCTA